MKPFSETDKSEAAFPSDLFAARDMSLRDYFAGQALIAVMNGTFTAAGAQNIKLLAKIRQIDETSIISQLTYEIADAMIETRNKVNS